MVNCDKQADTVKFCWKGCASSTQTAKLLRRARSPSVLLYGQFCGLIAGGRPPGRQSPGCPLHLGHQGVAWPDVAGRKVSGSLAGVYGSLGGAGWLFSSPYNQNICTPQQTVLGLDGCFLKQLLAGALEQGSSIQRRREHG